MPVIIRTHGGLGNQIFQILYSRLLSSTKGFDIVYYRHDPNYARRCLWEYPKSDKMLKAKGWNRLMTYSFMPKILYRLGISKSERINFSSLYLLDGYFNSLECFLKFSPELISLEINHIKEELLGTNDSMLQFKKGRGVLHHLRLGDFFNTELEEFNFIETKLTTLPKGSSIISNRDDLMMTPYIMEKISKKDLTYFKTSNLSGLELIKFMSEYEEIHSNGSTLAFWGALIGGGKANLNNKNLQDLFDFFIECCRLNKKTV